jgi:hypothetical protein
MEGMAQSPMELCALPWTEAQQGPPSLELNLQNVQR